MGWKALQLMKKERFVPEILKHCRQHIRKQASDGDASLLSFKGSSGTEFTHLVFHDKCFSVIVVVKKVCSTYIVYRRNFAAVESVFEWPEFLDCVTGNR